MLFHTILYPVYKRIIARIKLVNCTPNKINILFNKTLIFKTIVPKCCWHIFKKSFCRIFGICEDIIFTSTLSTPLAASVCHSPAMKLTFFVAILSYLDFLFHDLVELWVHA